MVSNKNKKKVDLGKQIVKQHRFKKVIDAVKAMKGDGWTNFTSGIGTDRDKSSHNEFDLSDLPINAQMTLIDGLVRKDGLAKKIVKVPAKDAFKNWITITNDEENIVDKRLKGLNVLKHFQRLAIDTRKFGGGAILMVTKGGGALKTPIKTGDNIIRLINYTNADFELTSNGLVKDIESEYFNDFEFMKLKKQNGDTVTVHRSRLLILKGEQAGTPTNATNLPIDIWYWGESILVSLWDALGRYGIGMKGANTALQEMAISVLKVSGLEDLLSKMGDDDQQIANEALKGFQARLDAIAKTKSMVNMIFVDADKDNGEDFKRDTIHLSGVEPILNLSQMEISGMTNIPITRLFGRSPAGENSTGESDNNNYNAYLIDMQNDYVGLLQYTIDLLTGTVDRHIVEFNHPEPPTQTQLIANKEVQSKTDKIYVELGVMDAEEVRTNRFVGGESFDTSVEGSAPVLPVVTATQEPNKAEEPTKEENKDTQDYIASIKQD